MRFLFTKGAGKFDWLDLFAPDGSVQRIDCPKQGIIPHDMVHFAVEATLGARGFLKRIDEGEAPSRGPIDDVEAEAIERLVETIQADAWSAPSAPDDLVALYRITCAARGHAAIPVTAADVAAITDALMDLTLRWDEVPVGGSLELQF